MWAPLLARPQLTSGCTQPRIVLRALRGAQGPACFHSAASSPPCASPETHVRPSQELAHQSPREGESLGTTRCLPEAERAARRGSRALGRKGEESSGSGGLGTALRQREQHRNGAPGSQENRGRGLGKAGKAVLQADGALWLRHHVHSVGRSRGRS